MEEKYRVFAEKYNKMLDLVEKVDPDLMKKYQKVMSKMPKYVLRKLGENKEFSCDGTDFRVDFDKYDEMIEFQYTTFKKYFNVSMNLYPYYDDELLEDDELDEEIEIDPEIEDKEDGNLFIFSLNMTNTEDEAKIKINFEEKDGEYKYINTETAGLELDYSVFVEKLENEEFRLVSRYTLNGVEAYKKELPISYDALQEYAIVDDKENTNENEDFEEYYDEGEWSSDLD